jgi:hypothetical protein
LPQGVGTTQTDSVTPNSLAWALLYAWPLVAISVFALRRSTATLARTTAWMMLLPAMFLPAMIELPFAALHKHRIAVLSVAAALLLFHRDEVLARRTGRRFGVVILLLVTFGAVQTARTNGDALTFGILHLPALTLRDTAWITYAFVVDTYLPFTIGLVVFRSKRDIVDLLDVLSKAALVYAPLCAIELRFSPQLSNWIYGYFPHSFEQMIRGGGYRPIVFMNHGLSVAMFLFTGFCAAVALYRSRVRVSPGPRTRVAVGGALLLMGGNLAATIYAAAAVVLLGVRSARPRVAAVIILAVIVAGYPVLRASDLVPTQRIARGFERISADRASSLLFRFTQEDFLLARAMERPLYGWGGWGRNRLYDWWGADGDEWAGVRDRAITDGTWIIVLGNTGFVGFVGLFAFLLVPLFRYARRCATSPSRSESLYGGLAIVLAVSVLDLLPNSQSDLLPLIYAGALFGVGREAFDDGPAGNVDETLTDRNTSPIPVVT